MNADPKRERAVAPRYYRIACRFWGDEKASKWPDEDKLLALYLLTNRHRTVEGLYVLPLDYVVVDLGWEMDRIRTCLARLVRDRFVRYDDKTRVILIKNAMKYQTPELPNVIEGVIRRLKELPKTPLLRECLKLARKHCGVDESSKSAKRFLSELQTAFPGAFKTTSQSPSALLISDSDSSSKLKLKAPPLPWPHAADGRISEVLIPPLGMETDRDGGPKPASELVQSLRKRAEEESH